MDGLDTKVRNFINQQDLSLPLSTAQGVATVPFQRWFKFKEAFSPKFVLDVINKSPIKVNKIFDPFGGSGTTSITSQMLGVTPTTIEVNPFLADLIESKLESYDCDQVIADWVQICRVVSYQKPKLDKIFENAPKTLYENESVERWIFGKDVFYRISQYKSAIEKTDCLKSKTLFKVLLGSILIAVSNVLVNGKGRRYRQNWQALNHKAGLVDDLFSEKVNEAIFDISKYSRRQKRNFKLLRGDSRVLIESVSSQDLVIFSPPYPNTFDYTDIYNVELWALGYLTNVQDNQTLRKSTLRSHVQVKTDIATPPKSKTLATTLDTLDSKKEQLWNKNIPSMVGSYFFDIEKILKESYRILNEGGMTVIVIGDSRYVDVKIDTAKITKEISKSIGYKVISSEEIRVMKSSAQQGWSKDLSETALYLAKI